MLKLVTTNQNFFLILYTLIMDGRLLMGRPWRVAPLYILWVQVPATSGLLVEICFGLEWIGQRVKIESPLGLGLEKKLGLLGHSFTCIG